MTFSTNLLYGFMLIMNSTQETGNHLIPDQMKVNKPYIVYTIKSIIKKCDKTFNICLVDDNSFEKLIDGWSIDLSKIDVTMRNKVRTLAMCKLLHLYGGINVPPSLCSRT